MLVAAGSERFLVDCGEGTQRQMLRAGTGFRRLRHILLTHSHLDHVLGVGGLIATLALMDVRQELTICGSAETIEFVSGYLASLWHPSLSDSGSASGGPVPLRLAVLEPGPVLTGGDLAVTCFPVRHRGTQSLGYRFEEPPRRHLQSERLAELAVPSGPWRARLAAGESIELPDGSRVEPEAVQGPSTRGASLVVVGDAEEVETLAAPARHADALVIEATFLEADAALAAQRGHLTAAEAGRLARRAGVGSLYLTHFSGRYEPEAVRAEAARHFAEVVLAKDFYKAAVRPRAAGLLHR